MKNIFPLILMLALTFSFTSCDTLQSVSGLPGGGNTSTPHTPAAIPSNSEISSGLKQALQIGIREGVQKVSAKNGFFGDPLIKILFPPKAIKVENTLRRLGLNQLCDKVILSLNRAAEKAAKEATPIFINALKKMSFNDARNILLGPDTAATNYFRRTTSKELRAKFKPVIENSLNEVGATHYWSQIMNQYNRIPLVKPINPDLSAYVTQKAIDGLFVMIAGKEKQIRENLGARSTSLLKKVFGYADKRQ